MDRNNLNIQNLINSTNKILQFVISVIYYILKFYVDIIYSPIKFVYKGAYKISSSLVDKAIAIKAYYKTRPKKLKSTPVKVEKKIQLKIEQKELKRSVAQVTTKHQNGLNHKVKYKLTTNRPKHKNKLSTLQIIFFPVYLLSKAIKAITKFEFKVKPFSIGFTLLTIFTIAVMAFLVLYITIIADLPEIDNLKDFSPKQTNNIYDRRGNLLYRMYGNEDRYYVKLTEISPVILNATLSAEDANFYEHFGLSLKGIVRAIKKSYLEDDLQGGSTITQQLVKNTLLTNERTYTRKIKEAILSLELERKFTKEQILEMYINKISYGGTAYGIKSAALKYFNKTLSEITLSEAAFLAGLPASPSNYSPLNNDFKKSKNRQKEVLDLMVKAGYITQKELDDAYKEPLAFSPHIESIKYPHFVNYVIAELEKKYGQKVIQQGGLEIYTSIDPDLQNRLQQIVSENIKLMKPRYNVGNGAGLITNPKTGEILAMVGSANYWDEKNDGQVNVTTAIRQPGSSIKPITYSLAFEKGYTPFDTINDEAVVFKLSNSDTYKPVNYDGIFHGKVTLKTALANSYNIPAVKLLDKLGTDKFLDYSGTLGITTFGEDRGRYGLSITLGAGEVKMTDMAVVYGVFANSGKRVNLEPVLRIYDTNGDVVYKNACLNLSSYEESLISNRTLKAIDINGIEQGVNTSCVEQKVINEITAYYINDILSDNAARMPAFGASNNLTIKPKQVAVKTGTTQETRDNWAIGYTQDFVVVTWIGNNDNKPMKSVASGYNSASKLWKETWDYLIKNRKITDKFARPSDMVEVLVCPLTNTLSCNGCPNIKRLYKKGTEPTTRCSTEAVLEILNKYKEKEEDKNDD